MYSPKMDLTMPTTHLHAVSAVRRKPLRTYKSPSLREMSSPIILRASSASPKKQVLRTSSEPSSSLTLTPQNHDPVYSLMKRKRYPMAPPLPLYHPLGPLALSLPPLDPTIFGLPAQPPTEEDEDDKRAPGHTRRPASKVRDNEEENTPSATNGAAGDQVSDAPTPPAPTVPETREKGSPRKRRAGGGKRKRKEVDDGDATYPAKRTRAPRGAAKEQTMEDESPTEAGIAGGEGGTPEPLIEEKRPERRSTRSSGMKRRDSSASETTSIAASVINKAKDVDAMEVDKQSVSDETRPASVTRSEKEEGELSEEGQAMVS